GWGWAAYLLPFVEQDNLFRQIQITRDIKDPANSAPRVLSVPLYLCPSDNAPPTFTVDVLNDPTPDYSPPLPASARRPLPGPLTPPGPARAPLPLPLHHRPADVHRGRPERPDPRLLHPPDRLRRPAGAGRPVQLRRDLRQPRDHPRPGLPRPRPGPQRSPP